MKRTFDKITRIPIDKITVINPRSRGRAKFRQIVDNIARLGLKKPITVALDGCENGEQKYKLVCGQGRLEAFQALGEEEIPAIVVEGSHEDMLLMSLAENLARRQHSSVELVRDIRILKERGYSYTEISKKIDLATSYVRGILQLLERGEERLIRAVEKRQIPITIAITVARSDDAAVQRALTEAYESNTLRGKQILSARKIIESRRVHGKSARIIHQRFAEGLEPTREALRL